VIRNRDLLADALRALRTCAGRPRLPARVGGSLEQYTPDRLDLLRRGEGERGPDGGGAIRGVRPKLERLRLSVDGNPLASSSLPCVIAVQDSIPSKVGCELRVVFAEVSASRRRAAATAIAKYRGAQRTCDLDARSVTPVGARERSGHEDGR
jgi:hypothetical protein